MTLLLLASRPMSGRLFFAFCERFAG